MDLKLKKLSKDLGVTKQGSSTGPGPSSQGLSLTPETIGTLAKYFTGEKQDNEEIDATDGSPIESLISWGLQNQDHPLVKAFMNGMTKGTKEQPSNEQEGQDGFI